MPDEEYRKRKEEDRQVLRALEIEELKNTIRKTPPEEVEKLTIVMGERTFTLDEMLAQIQERTEYGELYISSMSKSRIERLRRR